MSHDLVTLTTFATAEEAHMAQNRLEAEGLKAYLADENTVGMIWHLGNALGGVKLQVAEEELERAEEILASPGAEVEAGMLPQPPAVEEDCAEGEDRLQSEAAGDDEDQAERFPGDAIASRAWRAAIVGLFICPPLLHIYSMWLILRLGFSSEELSPSGTRKVWGTLAINLVIVLFIWLAFQMA